MLLRGGRRELALLLGVPFWPPFGVVAEVEAEAVGDGEADALLRPLFGVSISSGEVLPSDSKLFRDATSSGQLPVSANRRIKGGISVRQGQ